MLDKHITKPYSVGGVDVTERDIAEIIDGFAHVPTHFRTSDVVKYFQPHLGMSYQHAQEGLNRLFQRWRKLGLIVFNSGGRWSLTAGAWSKMQRAAASTKAK